MYIEISHIPPTVEALIAALGVLGGAMAFCSGLLAAVAFVVSRSPALLANAVNWGFALGFIGGMILATRTFMIVIGNVP